VSGDPLGLVATTRKFLGSLEGTAQVALGLFLVIGAVLAIAAATPAGKTAIRSSGRAGKLALELIPQTRAIGALL
jgi:hypothetical protein